jgi:hypothetical protein
MEIGIAIKQQPQSLGAHPQAGHVLQHREEAK